MAAKSVRAEISCCCRCLEPYNALHVQADVNLFSTETAFYCLLLFIRMKSLFFVLQYATANTLIWIVLTTLAMYM
jgi:hypothetical protein